MGSTLGIYLTCVLSRLTESIELLKKKSVLFMGYLIVTAQPSVKTSEIYTSSLRPCLNLRGCVCESGQAFFSPLDTKVNSFNACSF